MLPPARRLLQITSVYAAHPIVHSSQHFARRFTPLNKIICLAYVTYSRVQALTDHRFRVYKTALEYINEFSNASPDVIDSMRT